MNIIKGFFQRIVELSPEEWDLFLSKFQKKEFKEKEEIISVGEVCNKVVFIESGILTMVYSKDGREFIREFIFDNDVASVYESYLNGKPSRYSLRAVRQSKVYILHKADITQLTIKIPALSRISLTVTEQVYLNISRRFESMLTESAEERYLNLLEKRPTLMQDLPQYMVASYLGITDVALSRIRARVVKR